ncbi:MAG TPA: rhodanese-like domain-containing protein [Acidimicrobiales bacterium]
MNARPDAVTGLDPGGAGRAVDGGALLLDVREDDEWSEGHAHGAVHMPMGQVAGRIDEVPTDRTVICVCRVGGRSMAVANDLAVAGYDVRNLEGGMLAWELAGLPVVNSGGGPGRII